MSRIFFTSSKIVLDKINGRDKNVFRFKLNQVVKAKVLQIINPRIANLLVEGKNITAKVSTPLRSGEEVFLKVVENGQQPVFRLVNPIEEDVVKQYQMVVKSTGKTGPYRELPVLLRTLDDLEKNENNPDIRELVGKMKKLLFSTALVSEDADHKILNKFIQNSGLIWESKLRDFVFKKNVFSKDHVEKMVRNDLKALAAELLTHVKDKYESAEKGVRVFINHLEAFQVINRFTSEEFGRFLIHFPALFENQLRFGQILIDLNTPNHLDKESQNNLIRIALLLEFTNLGDFLADFSVLKNAVSGSFGVSNSSIQVFIENHIPELVSRLNANGFTAQRIECRVMNPETLSGVSLGDRLMDGYSGVLNLVI